MKSILFVIILSFGFNLNAQQAWTQKKGEGYFQIGSSFLSYSELHNLTSDAIELPRPITELIISSYLEYGISDNLTASFILPFHIVSSGNLVSDWSSFSPEQGDLSALGNMNLGLTYKVSQINNIVVSSKLAIGINSSKYEQSTGLRTGYDAYTISSSILAGLGTSTYFASAETGINFLTDGYLHRFIFNAQIGKHFLQSKKLLFIFSVLTSTALGSSSADDILKLDGNSRFTGLYVNEESYYAINLKLGYNLTKDWTIWSSIAGGMAKNIGRNALYSLSIGYNLK
ncbi:MAG: hypothetical protein V3V16_07975 [Melioribacteraceae bacterium]